jgi:hypothetical protein
MFRWIDEENRFLREDVDSTIKEFPGLLNLKTWIKGTFQS